jgi:ribonuclease G
MMFFGFGRKNKMKREIIINAESLETRVAIMESGRLEEFQVEHPTESRIVGSIYKGRIQNLEHDLQAAFVDVGLKKNAFLHYWDMYPDDDMRLENEAGRRGGARKKRFSNDDVEKRFPPGTEIVVQVTKGAIGTKGPRVTASLSLPGRYLVLMPGCGLKGVSRKIEDAEERQRLKKALDRLHPPPDAGLIVRTAASGARRKNLARDLRVLDLAWQELQQAVREKPAPCCVYQEPDLVERVVRDWLTEDVDRIVVDSKDKYERIREVAATISRRTRGRVQLYEGELPIFGNFMVENQLEEAFRRKVMLKSGGCIVLDETEALVAVDVNSGSYKGSGSQEDAILQVNTEAVEEVARQLRLRNIGGLVVIDLIDMKSRKHRALVYKAMKTALNRDRARTNVLQISDLGIMEMTRQRAEESIASAIFMDCPYCKGHGSVRSSLAMSVEIQRQIAAVLRKRRKGSGPQNLQVIVHPTVLERLRSEDEQLLLDLQSRFEGRLSFRSDPSRHVEFFSVLDADTGDVLYVTVDR